MDLHPPARGADEGSDLVPELEGEVGDGDGADAEPPGVSGVRIVLPIDGGERARAPEGAEVGEGVDRELVLPGGLDEPLDRGDLHVDVVHRRAMPAGRVNEEGGDARVARVLQ